MRGGVLIVIGLLLSLGSAYLWNAWTRASHWASVPGTLIFADLRTNYHHDPSRDDEISYAVDVRYRYRVNGREYLGARFSTARWMSSQDRELDRVNTIQHRQAELGSIPVYYNPHKPGESALDVQVSPLAFLGLNAGLVLLALGLASAYPGKEVALFYKIAMGSFLSAALLGVPYLLFSWSVNRFLLIAWIVLLGLPFTGFGAAKPFRSARRVR